MILPTLILQLYTALKTIFNCNNGFTNLNSSALYSIKNCNNDFLTAIMVLPTLILQLYTALKTF